jgi:hypothetical protein
LPHLISAFPHATHHCPPLAAVIQPTDLLVVQRDGTTCRATAAELQELLGRPLCSATAGRLWDLNSTPADNDWRAVCWAAELNLFVAVSIDGSQRVMTSSDGLRWIPRRTPSDNNSWIGICWSPELRLLVAIASNGSSNRVMTSSDGITWTSRRVPLNNNWVAICWSPQRRLFVAAAFGGNSSRVLTSPDGITWTARQTPASHIWRPPAATAPTRR